MIQMKVDPVNVIPINYNDPFIPDSLQRFNPTLYKQGDFFCCILGPNPQQGIFGCGHSPDAAINAWNVHFLNNYPIPQQTIRSCNMSLTISTPQTRRFGRKNHFPDHVLQC